MRDLAGLLKLLNLNTLIFKLIDQYEEVLIRIYLLNYEVQEEDQLTLKTKTKNVFHGVMLDMLILQKNIQKELNKKKKKKNLIIINFSFLYNKKILTRLK